MSSFSIRKPHSVLCHQCRLPTFHLSMVLSFHYLCHSKYKFLFVIGNSLLLIGRQIVEQPSSIFRSESCCPMYRIVA
ncbi:MAG: hypothetical protein J5642_02090 [Bacteroidales bacterium]|nr:hypothetical protein [Bacteroidales bacterium]